MTGEWLMLSAMPSPMCGNCGLREGIERWVDKGDGTGWQHDIYWMWCVACLPSQDEGALVDRLGRMAAGYFG